MIFGKGIATTLRDVNGGSVVVKLTMQVDDYIASKRTYEMKTLLRSLLILTLVVGTGACTSILGPQHGPDAGNDFHGPDAGNK